MTILGIYDGHNCGCCIIEDGKILCAVEEERLSRIKNHDGRIAEQGLPYRSLELCLKKTSKKIDTIALGLQDSQSLQADAVKLFFKNIYEDKNYLRLTCQNIKGRNVSSLDVINNPLDMQDLRINALKELLKKYKLSKKPIHYVNHHLAHCASAYYFSGIKKGLIVSLDGKGDNYSGMVAIGSKGKVEIKEVVDYVHSIGHFYSAITAALGFKPVHHEGKITGLAAYGKPNRSLYRSLNKVVFLKNDSIKTSLNQNIPLAPYPHTEFGENVKRIEKIIKGHSKEDVAFAAQKILEKVVVGYIKILIKKYKINDILLAGGVFANVKLNQKIHEIKNIKNIFIQPAMSDAGVSLGAAIHVYNKLSKLKYKTNTIKNLFFGPEYTDKEVLLELKKTNLKYKKIGNIEKNIAQLLSQGKIIARFTGACEYGPRALGNRSILYQATDPTVQDWLNQKLKRTEFMPFAPITLNRYRNQCYKNTKGAEYSAQFMTITFKCTQKMKKQSPAVVHIDDTARPQLVIKEKNPQLFKILYYYNKLTGIPTLINTSFNMHGEPIVCSPQDAIKSFQQSKLDYLAINNFIIKNEE